MSHIWDIAPTQDNGSRRFQESWNLGVERIEKQIPRCARDDNRVANSGIDGRAKKDGDINSPVHEPEEGRTKVRPLQKRRTEAPVFPVGTGTQKTRKTG